MATAVTVLIGILSAGLLSGRIYELLRLTDTQTGFFIYKGIVFNPVILALFAVIVVCCGILIFGDDKTAAPFFSKSSRPIAVASGAMLAVYSALTVVAGGIPVAAVAGALTMLVVGVAGLSPQMSAKNIMVAVFSLIFIVGYCLDVIVLDVCTVYNIEFTKNALCTLAMALLLMAVMKNIWSPSKYSKMLLYISGMLAFAMCGVMHIADIVYLAITSSIQPQQMVLHAGFAFAGLYGLDNAVSVLPKKQKATAEQPPVAEQVDVENVQDTIRAQLTAIVDSQQQPAIEEEEVTAYIPAPQTTEKSAEYTKFFAEMYGTQTEAPQPPQRQQLPSSRPVTLNIKQLGEEFSQQKTQPVSTAAPQQDTATAEETKAAPAAKTTWKAEGGKTVYKKPKN
ncbi:MAG: hypothetical protein IIV99_06030 [Oscillospiraceae bacterium]|nr:hypothetical protein [Oscillospiraceae bacterium]